MWDVNLRIVTEFAAQMGHIALFGEGHLYKKAFSWAFEPAGLLEDGILAVQDFVEGKIEPVRVPGIQSCLHPSD